MAESKTDNGDAMWEAAKKRLDEVNKIAGIEPLLIERLKHPKLATEATLRVRRDDGGETLYTAYRVRHDDSRGPAKGGIRFHPEVNLGETKSLALWMTIKVRLRPQPCAINASYLLIWCHSVVCSGGHSIRGRQRRCDC